MLAIVAFRIAVRSAGRRFNLDLRGFMVRIGSALFNADHTRLGDELLRAEAAGIDFFHFDVFDGYFVPDQAFPARTIKWLRRLTKLPFEVHLAANDPVRFLPALADAGVDLVFLPAESVALLYEAIFTVREQGMKVGLCLALGTPLALLDSTLPMIDSVLLLGRVTGEGKRGRGFNRLVIERVRQVRRRSDVAGGLIDVQAAGGLEMANCAEVVQAGATSLPLGAALHREADMALFVSRLRQCIGKGLEDLGSQIVDRNASRDLQAAILAPANAASGAEAQTFNVLVASRSFGKNCPEVLERMKAAGCAFMPSDYDLAPSEKDLLALIPDADVLISGTEPVTARVIAAARRLKVISRHGVGFENIDLAAARERGIRVAIAGGVIADSVADMTLALLLALARQIPQGNASVKRGQWQRFVGPELRGKTLGLVGLGQIGRSVCVRAKGFGMRLVAHDLCPDRAFAASWGVEYRALDELLGTADFVSLHLPVTVETRHLINWERLNRMKRGSFLINTARGELVDEAALYEVLSSGHLAGAAADVFSTEPPGENRLLQLENFVAMPHSASQTPEGLRRMGEITAENALRVLRGQEPLFFVD
jgi:ribulose-phosphate 3-epimerase